MRRLPIRLRLTAAFALAMAAVLAATGFFLFVRLGSALDDTIDSGLRSRSAEVSALVHGGGDLRSVSSSEDSFAQLIRPDGSVAESTPHAGTLPLLTPAEAQRASTGPVMVDRDRLPGLDDPARLLAVPADGNVLVVGASTESRAEALGSLFGELLIAAPIALLLASFLAYGLATAALRPVESMNATCCVVRPWAAARYESPSR